MGRPGTDSATTGLNGIVCTGSSHDGARRDCGIRPPRYSAGQNPVRTALNEISCSGSGRHGIRLDLCVRHPKHCGTQRHSCLYWTRLRCLTALLCSATTMAVPHVLFLSRIRSPRLLRGCCTDRNRKERRVRTALGAIVSQRSLVFLTAVRGCSSRNLVFGMV